MFATCLDLFSRQKFGAMTSGITTIAEEIDMRTQLSSLVVIYGPSIGGYGKIEVRRSKEVTKEETTHGL